MDDKIALQTGNNASNDDGEVNGQDIFEQRFHELMDIFGEQCEKLGVETAMAIAIHPLPTGLNEQDAALFSKPMVFYRGNVLDAMTLAAEVLRSFKASLSESLDTNPR